MTTTQKPIQIDKLVSELIEMTEVQIPSTITDPFLRELYRNEMLVLQRVAREMQDKGFPMSGEWLSGIILGMETVMRRIQDVQQAGLKEVYRENFKQEDSVE